MTQKAPLEVISKTAAATRRLGEKLGRALRGGEFIGLAGDLGAGKTVLVRGIAQGAEVPKEALVASPSFAIVNAYAGGRVPLYHADLYRVVDAEELYDAGFYDLIGTASMVVEWIDRVREVAPADWLEIRIERAEGGRRITLVPHGAGAEQLAASVAQG